MSGKLQAAAGKLARDVRRLRFGAPVAHVYHPLDYAWAAHAQYLRRYGGGGKRALFVGMNPGPWGMAQTGIPFGDVASVRDWLGIQADIAPPPRGTHRKRPVQGFACPRREVSGSRLWAFFAERYGSADAFFADYFVINYCPLLFLAESGANLTPDKLPAAEVAPLYRHCDGFLKTAVELLQPETLVGVGGFAEARLRRLFGGDSARRVGRMLHPSPASPAANRAFNESAAAALAALGI